MTDPGHDVTELDQRLSEIDRRLREIQSELAPPGSPPPAPARQPSAPAEEPHGRQGPLAEILQRGPRPSRLADEQLLARIEQLTELQGQVVVSLRELLERFDTAVAQPPPANPGQMLTAGPFASLEEVRAFERTLRGVPGVAEVSVRGYEGSDRALIEVRLSRPTA